MAGMIRTEPSHKRVRVFFGGQLIVDTDDALYGWEVPVYPQYYLPIADVAAGVLQPSRTDGDRTYFTVRAGGREAVDAAWSDADGLADRVRFVWNAMDAVFEEDEEVFVHPRDPISRVQILPSSRHVLVTVDGVTVADSHRPVFLHETHLPRRTYLPKLDVRTDLLVPTTTSTMCPYKGTARYWSLVLPGGDHTDIVWSYPAPLRESAPIAGLMCFYDDRVELTVDRVRPTGGRRSAEGASSATG